MIKKQYNKMDWSKIQLDTEVTVMDTSDNHFSAELPEDTRELYNDNGTICIDRSI